MATAERERLYFNSIKENRGSYFVEYRPPIGNYPFATLSLVYPGTYQLQLVAEAMHEEMTLWLTRYPVPVMVTAFDVTEDIIQPNGKGGYKDGYLFGWIDSSTSRIAFSWNLNELPPSLNDTTCLLDWRTIYTDIPHRTDTEVKEGARAQLQGRRRQVSGIKILLTVWLAVIPAAWAIAQYFGPEWLGCIVMLYTLWQVWRTWQKLMGVRKSSNREQEKSEKEQKMAHYYYHCERNPDGFLRLKAENFTKMISEQNKKEAEELAGRAPQKPAV